MSWPTARLDELVDSDAPIVYGILKPGPDVPGGVPYVRPSEMTHDSIKSQGILRTTPEMAAQFHRSTLRTGDLLLTIVGTIGKVAEVPAALDGGNITQCTVRIRPNRKVAHPPYVRWALRTPEINRQFDRNRFGSAVQRLNVAHARALTIPLPPLPEQKRIAAILDKADEIRKKRAEAIKLTEKLLRSAFLEMFGDPVTNPKGWPVAKIGDGISKIEAGWSVGGEPRVPNESEDAVLKISAVTSGWFKPDECKAVPSHSRDVPRPMKGDLLFSRANTRDLVAATCLVEQDTPGRFLPDKLWRVVPNDRLTPEYLRYALSDDGFRWELTKQATGTSGSMLNVSKAKFLGAMIPMPNLEQQQKFATVVWQIYEARARMNSDANDAELLVAALTQRAFSGEL